MRKSKLPGIVAAALASLLLAASCGQWEVRFTFERPVPTPTATATSSPSPTPSTTPQIAQLATPVAVPEGTPAPTVEVAPSVSPEESQMVVRRFFAALEAEDEAALAETTAGEASDTARAIVDEVRRQEDANRVELSARTRTLDFVGVEPRGTGVALTANYAMDISARAGFFTVPVQAREGQAVFTVDRREGQPRITKIEGIGV